jgi:hypothetical protein
MLFGAEICLEFLNRTLDMTTADPTADLRRYLSQHAMMQAHVSHRNNLGKEPWGYTSVPDYILDRGRDFTGTEPLTDEQFAFLTSVAEEVRDEVAGRVFAPKQCFDNSMMMALADPDDRFAYCEGYAYTGTLPVHHAWLTLDGRLVDLTRSLRPEASQEFMASKAPQRDLRDRGLGVVPEGWVYFGLDFPRDVVCQYIRELGQTGSLIEDYNRGFPLFQQARLGKAPAPDPGEWSNMMKGMEAAQV